MTENEILILRTILVVGAFAATAVIVHLGCKLNVLQNKVAEW